MLLISNPPLTSSTWQKIPHLAFDFAIVSPLLATNLSSSARMELSAADQDAEAKRRFRDTGERYKAANLGYEPIVFEFSGGLGHDGPKIFNLIYQAHDSRMGQQSERDLRIRVSIDLQWGLHMILQ